IGVAKLEVHIRSRADPDTRDLADQADSGALAHPLAEPVRVATDGVRPGIPGDRGGLARLAVELLAHLTRVGRHSDAPATCVRDPSCRGRPGRGRSGTARGAARAWARSGPPALRERAPGGGPRAPVRRPPRTTPRRGRAPPPGTSRPRPRSRRRCAARRGRRPGAAWRIARPR